jgi:methionyl-tRNA synthetase
MTQREILVTHALPYANGPLHIGHLLGYIQTDIWVRARRMAGAKVHFVAADDVHGTPIMLAAEKAGMAPEEFIKGMQTSHEEDFRDFGVHHDYYYTTHSPENRELAEYVYTRLRDTGKIARRNVSQFYDPVKAMFLPDRYIKGECPVCGTPDQYGDNCENCGSTYAPTDLKNPRSVVSGATPEMRDSEHYFFEVGKFADFLREWLAGEVAHPSVKAKLKEWLDSEGGVRDWDISRDAPYFGFEIPDTKGTKFFYVWLDAPIGYLASFKKYCSSEQGRKNGLSPGYFHRFMRPDDPDFLAEAQMHHFIGKDIVNFHGLFWPAMLQGAGYREPTALHVNGYLTVNGAKMSKSRGTFIQARTYLEAGLNPDYLRYYFATMLSAAPTDVDLDLKAFEERVNSHLVGKWVNIASRTAGFVHQHHQGKLATLDEVHTETYHKEVAGVRTLALASYFGTPDAENIAERQFMPSGRGGEFNRALANIMVLADRANTLVAAARPWDLAKHDDEASRSQLHQICSLAINLFRAIAILLAPVVPKSAQGAAKFLNEDFAQWQFKDTDFPLEGHEIRVFEPLISRIDPKQIETMIESSKESMQPSISGATPASSQPSAAAAPKPIAHSQSSAPATISIDDFAKLDLRIATVVHCGFVDGSDKLLRFELDAGDLGKRQIFSGIRASYGEPEKLVGRKVVFIANLAPRKMRFGVSEGMILSAGGEGGLFLLDADDGAQAGMPVK